MEGCLTVLDLFKACQIQIARGNGGKQILISADEEGNDFHPLYFQFTSKQSDIDECLEYTCCNLPDAARKNIVILG